MFNSRMCDSLMKIYFSTKRAVKRSLECCLIVDKNLTIRWIFSKKIVPTQCLCFKTLPNIMRVMSFDSLDEGSTDIGRIVLNINIFETMLIQQHAWRCSNILMNYGLFKMYCDTNQVTRSNAKYCFIANWDIKLLHSRRDLYQMTGMPSVSVKFLITHNNVVDIGLVYEVECRKNFFHETKRFLMLPVTHEIFLSILTIFIPSIEKPYVEVRSV